MFHHTGRAAGRVGKCPPFRRLPSLKAYQKEGMKRVPMERRRMEFVTPEVDCADFANAGRRRFETPGRGPCVAERGWTTLSVAGNGNEKVP